MYLCLALPCVVVVILEGSEVTRKVTSIISSVILWNVSKFMSASLRLFPAVDTVNYPSFNGDAKCSQAALESRGQVQAQVG